MDATDAVPLAPHPDLDQYRKRAKELAAADPDAVRAWAQRWLSALTRAHHQPLTPEARERIARKAEQIERFARTVLGRDRGGALAGAQLVLARAHGFDGWAAFAAHVRALAAPSPEVFERAVDATVAGDLAELDALLREHPGLARARSPRRHRATLLHYLSGNGVEGHRQWTPPNAVAVAARLLDAGAEVDAPHDPVPKRRAGTALGLVATSTPAACAGVQVPLLTTLLDAGAAVDGAPGGWQPLAAALANGCPDAADLLARRGARITLVTAAGLGRLDLVTRFAPAEPAALGRALVVAATYGHAAVVEDLLDRGADPATVDAARQTALHLAAHGAHLETVDLLLRRGAPLEVVNSFGGTPLGQALWSAAQRDDPRYPAVVERLRAATDAASESPPWGRPA